MQPRNEFDQMLGTYMPTWIPRPRPNAAPLVGRTCSVEPLSLSRHTDGLFAALCNSEHDALWTYLPYGPFPTTALFTKWLTTLLATPDTMPFAIVDPRGNPCGMCAYSRIAPEHGSIEIAHLNFSIQLRRTVSSTEAMYLMMTNALSLLGYRRCEWKCNALNEDSKRAAQRLGFTFEGIFRQSNVFKHHSRDTAWFSLLDSEWPRVHEKLVRWLDLSNFYADGRQKCRLEDI